MTRSWLEWLVWKPGFVWVDNASHISPQVSNVKNAANSGSTSPILRLASQDGVSVTARKYRPMTEFPTLFHEFGNLGRDRRAILDFANRYGLLGLSDWLPKDNSPSQIGGESLDETERALPTESLKQWIVAIEKMNWAVRAWIALKQGNLDELRVLFEKGPPAGLRDVEQHGPGRLRSAGFGRTAARQGIVSMAITKAMGLQEPEVRKTLYSIITKNLEGAVEVRVSGTLVDDAAELELAPTSLLSGLWLQLALAVVEKKNVQFCRSCGRAILLATNEDGRQARRQFCGNACKVRGYRERKAQDAQD